MKATLIRWNAASEPGPRISYALLLLTLLAVAAFSLLTAVVRPLAFDEIVTMIVCRQPSLAALWDCLLHPVDANPPFYYLFAKLTRVLVGDDHLGYRLPSILGLLGGVTSVYFILSRRVSRLSAVVGAAFLLCTQLVADAVVARPYALMIACIAMAIFAWQRSDRSKLYALLLAVMLACAESLHYYAILAWSAFVAAEAAVWIFRRRSRFAIWAAFVVGASPLLFFFSHLLAVRQAMGKHFWALATASLLRGFSAYNFLFSFGGNWGLVFVAGLALTFLYMVASPRTISRTGQPAATASGAPPIEEQVLILALLLLPLVAEVGAKISHGGMYPRYMQPTLLGAALAFGYVIDRVPSPGRLLVLALLVINYTLSQGAIGCSLLHHSLLGQRMAAINQVKTIAALDGNPDLPIVVSDGLQYLPMDYYAPGIWRQKLFVLTDPRAAVAFSAIKTDSVDLGLMVLRPYYPVQVEDFDAFIGAHREFFVLLSDGPFDWWHGRLAQGGFKLELVLPRSALSGGSSGPAGNKPDLSTGTGAVLYKVTVTSQ